MEEVLGEKLEAVPGLQNTFEATTFLGVVRVRHLPYGWVWSLNYGEYSLRYERQFGLFQDAVLDANEVLGEIVKRARAWTPKLEPTL